jgi:hypothetical protein
LFYRFTTTITDMRPNPAKLDSVQYPLDGYSVQSSLDGDKTLYPNKTIETF